MSLAVTEEALALLAGSGLRNQCGIRLVCLPIMRTRLSSPPAGDPVPCEGVGRGGAERVKGQGKDH